MRHAKDRSSDFSERRFPSSESSKRRFRSAELGGRRVPSGEPSESEAGGRDDAAQRVAPMRARNFPESLQFAVAGILHAFRTQRNLRTHFGLGALVLLVALNFQLSRAEMGILILTIGLVVVAELVNTAVEFTVDLISERYHILAAHAKNVAAGAVLAASMTAALVGYVLFFDRLAHLHPSLMQRTIAIPSFVLLLTLVIVIVCVVALKALAPDFRLSGGMPSFHAAVAGALAAAVFFLAAEGTVAVLAFALAGLVAQSRVEGGIHTVWEVAVGGLLGVVMTAFLFQVLRG